MIRILILLLASSCCLTAGELRDGNFWQRMDFAQRLMWSAGWMDGVCTGKFVAADARYTDAVAQLDGLTTNELVAGMNQLYSADYRNLPISIQEAALFVARFSRTGMDRRDAAAQLAALREKYRLSVH